LKGGKMAAKRRQSGAPATKDEGREGQLAPLQ